MTEIPIEGLPSTDLPEERITIDMPDRPEMVRRLTEAEMYGESKVSDRVYDGFANQVAGSRKDGVGIVLAWQNAIFDGLEGAPSESHETIGGYFNLKFYKMIDAIVPDPREAGHVKIFMRNFEEKVMGKGRE